MSVTMCSALDSVEIIEYSSELCNYPGWNHEVDIKVFPVEVNLLIREYVACMLLSEKLEWELAKDSKNTSLQREREQPESSSQQHSMDLGSRKHRDTRCQ